MQQQTSDHSGTPQTPSQIEARLERDRDALSSSLNALRDRLTLDSLWKDGVALVTQNGGSYAQSLDAAVRANPLALAVAGVGVAWLIFGRRSDTPPASPPLAGTRFEAVTRWEDEGGPVAAPANPDDAWMEEADKLRDKAAKMLKDIDKAARRHLAPAADLARSRGDIMAALTSDVRHSMARGLDGLTGHARDAAMTARERAYDLRLRTAKVGIDAVQERPIAAGAVLAAAGATVAMLLPQSTAENRVLGAPRDQIMHEIGRVLHAEQRRVSASVERAAKAVLSEVSKIPMAKGDSGSGDAA